MRLPCLLPLGLTLALGAVEPPLVVRQTAEMPSVAPLKRVVRSGPAIRTASCSPVMPTSSLSRSRTPSSPGSSQASRTSSWRSNTNAPSSRTKARCSSAPEPK